MIDKIVLIFTATENARSHDLVSVIPYSCFPSPTTCFVYIKPPDQGHLHLPEAGMIGFAGNSKSVREMWIEREARMILRMSRKIHTSKLASACGWCDASMAI